VQTIVNVIEPEHGIVLDPACGTGGMFVQSSHFIERVGKDPMKRVTFYGHEKNETTARLAQINLAVNGLAARGESQPSQRGRSLYQSSWISSGSSGYAARLIARSSYPRCS
jgi:type I restriction-modification system DNA methylase subunit